jgi:hypothetical protein
MKHQKHNIGDKVNVRFLNHEYKCVIASVYSDNPLSFWVTAEKDGTKIPNVGTTEYPQKYANII